MKQRKSPNLVSLSQAKNNKKRIRTLFAITFFFLKDLPLFEFVYESYTDNPHSSFD